MFGSTLILSRLCFLGDRGQTFQRSRLKGWFLPDALLTMRQHYRNGSKQVIQFATNCPDLIAQISQLVAKAVDGPFTFDQLRTLEALRKLVEELKRCKEEFLVFSLLWCALDFTSKAANDETSVDTARSFACEIAAMRVLRRYDSNEVLVALTKDFVAIRRPFKRNSCDSTQPESMPTQTTPLLRIETRDTDIHRSGSDSSARAERTNSHSFTALEVAIVADAKRFTSAQIVQDILTEIWCGEIVFWTEISQNQQKRAQYYDRTKNGKFWNFARLRVPLYAFIMESFNFVVLSALYLLVVIDREYQNLGFIEIFLALWFLGFAYQEWDQVRSAGQIRFYMANVWNYFDLGIIMIAFAWITLRAIGIYEQDKFIVGRSYDVLSLEGVLLVPRLFSFLCLTPYFGTLFPCLRRLTVDFFKFLILVIALFLGFLITFSVLGRNKYSINEITWLLIRIFFGGSGLGFDAAKNLSPEFGEPLMLIFVTFTQILLTTVLISILANSFSKVMDNARAEYQFLFATTCLESSKSDHMVMLSPPFNLLYLFLVRPLRLFLPWNHWFLQTMKIGILKATHAPYMLAFSLYERSYFAPVSSEGHKRRLERSLPPTPLRRAMTQTLGTPLELVKAPTLLDPRSAATAAPRSAMSEENTDDEEGLDMGVMLDASSSSIDKATKLRLDNMERQMLEMKRMLEQALART